MEMGTTVLERLEELETLIKEFSIIDSAPDVLLLKSSIEEFKEQLSQKPILKNLSALASITQSDEERFFSLKKECFSLVINRGNSLEFNTQKRLRKAPARLKKAEKLLSEIQDLPQRPYTIQKPRQAKKRTAYITEPAPLDTPFERKLNTIFKEYKQETLGYPLSTSAKSDFIIQLKLASLKEMDQNAQRLYIQGKNLLKINTASLSSDELQGLQRTLEEVAQQLEALKTPKIELLSQIGVRHRLISPSITTINEKEYLEELVLHLRHAQQLLYLVLKDCLEKLVIISSLDRPLILEDQGFLNGVKQRVGEMISRKLKQEQPTQEKQKEGVFDRTNQLLQKRLNEFITAICKNLTSHTLTLNQTTVNELSPLLENLKAKNTDASKTIEAINALLLKLFDNTFYEKEPILRTQLFDLHHLRAIIQNFSPNLKPINNYYSIQIAFPRVEKPILEKAEKIKTERKELFIDLQYQLNLFKDNYYRIKVQPINKEIESIHRPWLTLEDNLTKLLETHQKSHQQVFQFNSETQMLSSLADATNMLSEQQKDTINKLDKLMDEHTKLKEQAIEVVVGLEEIYKKEKFILKKELGKAIVEAKTALGFYNTVFKTAPKDIEAVLAKEQKQFDSLGTPINNSLAILQHINNNAIERLKKHVTDVKKSIADKYKNKKESIINAIKDFKTPLLSSENPLKDQLTEMIKTADTQKEELDTHYSTLKDATARELSTWHTQFLASLSATERTKDTMKTLRKNAKILEARLNSPAYKIFLDIMDKFKGEYQRIITGHLPVANQKQRLDSVLDVAELNKLENTLANLIDKEGLLEEETNLLEQIDPRLCTIWSMQAEFKKINRDYINQDVLLCNDKAYLDKLIQAVETHIHNKDNRENLSKDMRPEFIQWIRINVFKPLQQQAQDFCNLFRKNKLTFFVTLGACKTEEHIAEHGNEVYKKLKEVEAEVLKQAESIAASA